jgi:membrane-bound lytic murein transglycosylase MltF
MQWSTIYQRPDLQIRSMILLSRSNYRSLTTVKDPLERMYFSDLAYNAGLGRVYKDRRLCGLRKECDPGRWFGQVEMTCTASSKAIYGNRSACDISRHHVYDVIKINLPKYKAVY